MKTVIVYFDESKKAPEYAKEDPRLKVLWPGHPECPFVKGADDEEWIPYAGKAGWIVIHRDERILKRRSQWDLVRESKLSMVAIRGAGREKMEVVHALLRPIWGKLPYYYHRCRRPWLIQIVYNGLEPRYEFYDHERIARDDWGRKQPFVRSSLGQEI